MRTLAPHSPVTAALAGAMAVSCLHHRPPPGPGRPTMLPPAKVKPAAVVATHARPRLVQRRRRRRRRRHLLTVWVPTAAGGAGALPMAGVPRGEAPRVVSLVPTRRHSMQGPVPPPHPPCPAPPGGRGLPVQARGATAGRCPRPRWRAWCRHPAAGRQPPPQLWRKTATSLAVASAVVAAAVVVAHPRRLQRPPRLCARLARRSRPRGSR